MGDKDSTIRKVVKEVFNVTMYICIFHTQQSFRNAVTREKMNITGDEREWCLETFRRMVYSKCLEEYETIRETFCKLAPKSVQEYFMKNWDNCFEEWTKFSMRESNYGNATNNRLESLNGKLKKDVGKNNSFLEFFTLFFKYFDSSYYEKDRVAVDTVAKKPRLSLKYDDLEQFREYLTPYAYRIVVLSYDKMCFVQKQSIKKISDNDYLIISKTRSKTCSAEDCTCSEFSSHELPCHHILFVRRSGGLPLFSPTLCSKRWSSEYYNNHQRLLRTSYNKDFSSVQGNFEKDCDNSVTDNSVKMISIKSRDRPKGRAKTTIGLPPKVNINVALPSQMPLKPQK